jgi:hypothetical protein
MFGTAAGSMKIPNYLHERPLFGVETRKASGSSGSGPGVELHATNGCCTSLTGHSNVEIDRL